MGKIKIDKPSESGKGIPTNVLGVAYGVNAAADFVVLRVGNWVSMQSAHSDKMTVDIEYVQDAWANFRPITGVTTG